MAQILPNVSNTYTRELCCFVVAGVSLDLLLAGRNKHNQPKNKLLIIELTICTVILPPIVTIAKKN